VTISAVKHLPAHGLARHVERSRLISKFPWVRHGITSRVPGLGLADGNVGYTAPRDEADAWQMRRDWAQAIGIDPSELVRVRQVHGCDIRIATTADTVRGTHPSADNAPVADAMITNEPAVALMTLHADCLAMLLVDPETRSVAAVHAGWRSTVQNIAGATVDTMRISYGTNPVDLIAYVGPSIGLERYEVGEDVIDAWMATGGSERAVRHSDGRWRFDLKAANAGQLADAGVSEENIEISPICTASDPQRWFSHRGQGPLTGRFAAIIAITGGGQ
jgi:YfiH family protein